MKPSRTRKQQGVRLSGRHKTGAGKGPSEKIKFGTDGWRGVIAEDFTDDNVRKVAHAIARYVARAEKPGSEILVGYDTRFGSERFARVAAEAVAATGTPVWLAADACPTPAISLLVRQRGAAAGIQITASHNPYRWNGMKLKASYGSSASPAIVAQVEAELEKVLRDGVPALAAAKGSASFARRAHALSRCARSASWIGTVCALRNSAS